MELSRYILTILPLLYKSIRGSLALDSDISNDFISKCLEQSNANENSCEDTRYRILDYYYTCDLINTFDSPPKRISKENDRILVAINDETFHVTSPHEELREVNTIIPPTGEIIDKFNNRFYAGDGTTYVVGPHEKKEIEIITSGNFALNEIALDDENNQLFILSFNIDHQGKQSGSLYAMRTNNIFNTDKMGKIRAQRIEDFGEKFSSIFIPKNSNSIYLGVSDFGTGKLLELKHKNFDPCTPGMQNRTYFRSIIKRATDELTKIFDEAMKYNTYPVLSHADHVDESELIKLKTENRMLEKEVSKLNSALTKISSIKQKYSSSSSWKIDKENNNMFSNNNPGLQEISCIREKNDLLITITDIISVLDSMNEETDSATRSKNGETDFVLSNILPTSLEDEPIDETIFDSATEESDEEYLVLHVL